MRALAASILLTSATLYSQDIHFSQFFNTPYALNPASIGAFDGQYRVGGVFRQQWRSVTVPYRTFGLGGDAANAIGVKGLGLGLWLYNDRAGDSHLNTFHVDLGGSWSQRVGNTGHQHVIGGLQFGVTHVNIDYSQLRFDAQYNGFYYDPSLSTNEQFSRDALTRTDVHAGVIYRDAPNKRQLLQAGFALFNITKPDVAFNDRPSPLDRRTVFHVMTRFPVSSDLDVQPVAQFMKQATFTEFDLGATVRYILLDKFGLFRTVEGGLLWRASDAGQLYAGFTQDDMTLGISYDLNFSDLVPASRNKGGLEITFVKVFRKKPPVPVRYKDCPTQL